MHPTYVFIGAFAAFVLYTRVRRAGGFQKIVPAQIWVRVGMFAVVCGVILLSGTGRVAAFAADLAGLAAGWCLAGVALRTTVLQKREDAWYFRPHPWIGVALLVLFLGRLAWRFALAYGPAAHAAGAAGASPLAIHFDFTSYSGDPLTAGIYFLLAAYYSVYYIVLLRRTAAARQTAAGVETSAGG